MPSVRCSGSASRRIASLEVSELPATATIIMIQLTPLRLTGIALVVAALAYTADREDVAAVVRANAPAVAYYSVLAAGGYVAGRQLASAFGSSPQQWLATALDALTGVIPLV
jgi:hypothetical protein